MLYGDITVKLEGKLCLSCKAWPRSFCDQYGRGTRLVFIMGMLYMHVLKVAHLHVPNGLSCMTFPIWFTMKASEG